jgi:hypothetical protein
MSEGRRRTTSDSETPRVPPDDHEASRSRGGWQSARMMVLCCLPIIGIIALAIMRSR